jgi:hypothetical protein
LQITTSVNPGTKRKNSYTNERIGKLENDFRIYLNEHIEKVKRDLATKESENNDLAQSRLELETS